MLYKSIKGQSYAMLCIPQHTLFDFVYAPEAKLQEMVIGYTQEMGALLPVLNPITARRLQIE